MQILFMTGKWFGTNIFVFWIICQWSQWAHIEKGKYYYDTSQDSLMATYNPNPGEENSLLMWPVLA